MTQVTCFVTNVTLDFQFTFRHFACPPSICRNLETGLRHKNGLVGIKWKWKVIQSLPLTRIFLSGDLYIASPNPCGDHFQIFWSVQFWERRNKKWQAEGTKSVHTKIMKGESMKGVDRCCPRGDALDFYCSFEVFAMKTQMNVPYTGDLYCLHVLNVFWPSKWSKNWAEHKTQCRLWNPGQVLLQLLLQALLCLCCEKQRKANSCGE